MHNRSEKNVRFNFTVNVIDGAFFGFGLGFASYVTVIPLFIASLTDSTALIGLIATVQVIGWQMPQLLTSSIVARVRNYRRMALLLSIHERWPFFGLALIALLQPYVDNRLILAAAFMLAILQGLGGGLGGTAWQSLISKVVPLRLRGTFYGSQSSAYSLMASIAAVLSGLMLGVLPYPLNFAACFFIAGISVMISWLFLSLTREEESQPRVYERQARPFTEQFKAILRGNPAFRWFLLARVLAQFGLMALAFNSIFAVREHGASEELIGILTAVFLIGNAMSGPVIGWLGDRVGHAYIFAVGNVVMAGSSLLALNAPELSWFYLIFLLAGVMDATQWTTIVALIAEFGPDEERPYYIGMANTLVSPATIIAPLVGGWLADSMGFGATYTMALICSLLAAVVLVGFVGDPVKMRMQREASARN